MMDNIKLFATEVDNLEKEYSLLNRTKDESVSLMKEQVLQLLSSLKYNQDKSCNEEHEDYFEDLIYRLIIILGKL